MGLKVDGTILRCSCTAPISIEASEYHAVMESNARPSDPHIYHDTDYMRDFGYWNQEVFRHKVGGMACNARKAWIKACERELVELEFNNDRVMRAWLEILTAAHNLQSDVIKLSPVQPSYRLIEFESAYRKAFKSNNSAGWNKYERQVFVSKWILGFMHTVSPIEAYAVKDIAERMIDPTLNVNAALAEAYLSHD